MDIYTIQLLILVLGIGLLFGSVISYFIMHRIMQKNITSLSQKIKILNAQQEDLPLEKGKRREDLLVLAILAGKLKQIENNIQMIRQKEFNTYIDKLNRLLDQTGITQVNVKD